MPAVKATSSIMTKVFSISNLDINDIISIVIAIIIARPRTPCTESYPKIHSVDYDQQCKRSFGAELDVGNLVT